LYFVMNIEINVNPTTLVFKYIVTISRHNPQSPAQSPQNYISQHPSCIGCANRWYHGSRYCQISYQY